MCELCDALGRMLHRHYNDKLGLLRAPGKGPRFRDPAVRLGPQSSIWVRASFLRKLRKAERKAKGTFNARDDRP